MRVKLIFFIFVAYFQLNANQSYKFEKFANDTIFFREHYLTSPCFSFDNIHFKPVFYDLPIAIYRNSFKVQFDSMVYPMLDSAKHITRWAGYKSGILFLGALSFFIINNSQEKPYVNPTYSLSLLPILALGVFETRHDMVAANSCLKNAITMRNSKLLLPADSTVKSDWAEMFPKRTNKIKVLIVGSIVGIAVGCISYIQFQNTTEK